MTLRDIQIWLYEILNAPQYMSNLEMGTIIFIWSGFLYFASQILWGLR